MIVATLAYTLWAAATASATREANPFTIFHKDAKRLFGPSPTLELLHENKSIPFAHEAGVFIPRDNTLFVTSNRFQDPSTQEQQQRIVITKVSLPPSSSSNKNRQPVRVEEVQTRNIPMPNGGVNYKNGILFCAQGSMNTSSGLSYMESRPPYRSRYILQSYMNRPFSSPNDLVVHRDGSIWFTDPIYGFEQGFRPKPRLPSQVYRFDPRTRSIRVVADGFGRPNGIAFSPDERVLYVTDTHRFHGDGVVDDTHPSTMRVFAMVDAGVPDGIKCDVYGNVYSGSGDGISIWSPGGTLLGKILVSGGVANFCFGRRGEIFILNEKRLLRAKLAPSTKGALLGI
ncbi:hypothetical protein E4U13_002262 [Claviceps humidiphila]|uniref:SMP-30/Gluconolactonase/LRE-like region domain-containing protein n=1 Tax=Claviceps humidiphila TaxID=1294629 RepID=A0A9P7Q4F3_9HYPO|nr:hypothetical protein E4U13_002262 [Claviceps humidiphila]